MIVIIPFVHTIKNGHSYWELILKIAQEVRVGLAW